MVGAMILARVSDESDFSDEVLSGTRAWTEHRRVQPQLACSRSACQRTCSAINVEMK
jgi:hypothetical protein